MPTTLPTLTLAATSFRKDQLLNPEIPQIALAGRSNVGKSSLINALANRKQLAKTSATPGKTRSINYYAINGLPIPAEESNLSLAPQYCNEIDQQKAFLVDLPGYGYAKCSHEERIKWAKLLEFYLANTHGLKALTLLLDARLTPQKLDIGLFQLARSLALPILPVLTKTDKCSKKELDKTICQWQVILGNSTLILTSSSKKRGIEELWEIFLQLLGG